MINLEKKELEFIMTAVNNVPVQGVAGCELAVQVFGKLKEIAQMKEPVVNEADGLKDKPSPEKAPKK